MNETERWICDYFATHGRADGYSPEEMMEDNYFERGVLDSLAVVQLVAGIEDDFEIRLKREHLQDQRFCTIRGLAQIVDEARST